MDRVIIVAGVTFSPEEETAVPNLAPSPFQGPGATVCHQHYRIIGKPGKIGGDQIVNARGVKPMNHPII